MVTFKCHAPILKKKNELGNLFYSMDSESEWEYFINSVKIISTSPFHPITTIFLNFFQNIFMYLSVYIVCFIPITTFGALALNEWQYKKIFNNLLKTGVFYIQHTKKNDIKCVVGWQSAY